MNKGLFLGLIAIPLSLLSCQKGESDSSVDHILVERVTLNKTELTLIEGDSEKLEATVFPENAENRTVSWSSSNAKVVMVTDGEVVAIALGSATITARAGNRQAQCQVTVQAFQYQAVDLGLSVKWGNANVGASKPEDYGEYYAWGETGAKEDYSLSTYKWWMASSYSFTKYNTSSAWGTVDNKTVLDPEDDVASVKLGGKWRMPTDAEWTELRTKCTWTWTDNYNGTGVTGRIVTAENGNSIFLPAAGSWAGTNFHNAGTWGWYWSSSLCTSSPDYAWLGNFYHYGGHRSQGGRSAGLSVRPVSD